MAKALKVAFLWHFHQPYYELDGEMALPWARLHAVKDYYELPRIFNGYPGVKHTLNLTPSLFEQLHMYVADGTSDKALSLSRKDASELSNEEKSDALEVLFRVNESNLLRPYKRYSQLLDRKNAGLEFTTKDIRDLQVWHNLAWLGNLSKQEPYISYLIQKGENFTEHEKHVLLDKHIEIISAIPNQLRNSEKIGNIRYSFSPYYHPILPLLLSDGSDFSQVNYPGLKSASSQIIGGKDYLKNELGIEPVGSWPSEGSLSDDVLDLYIDEGIKWVATDEAMLLKSEVDELEETSKFFPHVYRNDKGSINIFFRDTFLSDSIGFRYTNWNPKDASSDFIHHLKSIRGSIINKHGEESLDTAVVSIILDGENCWEYYRNNGFDFLNMFLKAISNMKEIDTVFFDDVGNEDNDKRIQSINPGSWINADFKIWDGHYEDLKAWEYLTSARLLFESKVDISNKEESEKYLSICEGSDWYWWFGPEHTAPDRLEFDKLFRKNLIKFYESIDEEVPEYLHQPIMQSESGLEQDRDEAINSWVKENHPESKIVYKHDQSTMHRGGNLLEGVYLSHDKHFLVLDFSERVPEEKLRINSNLFSFSKEINSVEIKTLESVREIESILVLEYQDIISGDIVIEYMGQDISINLG